MLKESHTEVEKQQTLEKKKLKNASKHDKVRHSLQRRATLGLG